MKKILYLIIPFLLILSACALKDLGLQPLVTAEPTVSIPTALQSGNTTPQPESSIAVNLAQSETSQTAIGLSPVADSDLEGLLKDASVIFNRALNDIDFLIVVQTTVNIPSGNIDSFSARVAGKSYNCTVLEQYTNRLYCVGEPPPSGMMATLEIFLKTSKQVVFQAAFTPVPLTTPMLSSPQPSGTVLSGMPSQAASSQPASTEQSGSGVVNLQPGGAVGGGVEDAGGGRGPTATSEPKKE